MWSHLSHPFSRLSRPSSLCFPHKRHAPVLFLPCVGLAPGAARFSYSEEPRNGQSTPDVSSAGLRSSITPLHLLATFFGMQLRIPLPFPSRAHRWLNPSSVYWFWLLHPLWEPAGHTARPKPKAVPLPGTGLPLGEAGPAEGARLPAAHQKAQHRAPAESSTRPRCSRGAGPAVGAPGGAGTGAQPRRVTTPAGMATASPGWVTDPWRA